MRLISNIEIKNFKSIRHQKIDGCRKINVFIGYPNVGKSNILEALGLYSVLLSGTEGLFRLNDICRIKHFSEFFFNQNYRDALKIIINDQYELDVSAPQTINSVQLQFGTLKGFEKNVQKDFDGFLRMNVDQDMQIKRLASPIMIFEDKPDFRFPDFFIKKYSFISDPFGNYFKSLSLNIPYGTNLLDVLQHEVSLRKDLAEILSVYGLKLLLDASTGTIFLIKELDESSVVRIPYYQIADTLKRLIFFKSAVCTNSNTVLLFEEPEAHMFPPYIKKFTTDVIFDKTNQFFIATHSPYVLGEFVEEAKNDLAIYVVDYVKGETLIKRLTDEEVTEIAQYGIDLFFNLESYLDKYGQPRSA